MELDAQRREVGAAHAPRLDAQLALEDLCRDSTLARKTPLVQLAQLGA